MHLTQQCKTSVRAANALVGTIIGVGVFGLPFVFVQSGLVLGFAYLVGLGVLTMTLQLMLAEVSLQMPGYDRIAGLVRKLIGPKWGVCAAVVSMLGAWGGLIAYALVGGLFAHALLAPWVGGGVLLYQLGFLVVGFALSLHGLKWVSVLDGWLVWGMLACMVALMAWGLSSVDVQQWSQNAWVGSAPFLPYGVVLFALSGLNVVPELKQILGRYRSALRVIIPWSTVAVVALYGLFVLAVVGVSGGNTSREVILGMSAVLGSGVLVLGALFGIGTTSTSFLLQALSVQDMMEYDYHWTRLLAWVATFVVPVLVVLSGSQDIIRVMSITGGVFGGITAAFVVVLYIRVRTASCHGPHECVYIPNALAWTILVGFLVGVVLELVRLFV